MRIDEGITGLLTALEFRAVNIGIKSMRLFIRQRDASMDAVLLFYSIYGNELGEEEYRRIVSDIKTRFFYSGFSCVNLLGLILTDFPEDTRRYCTEPGVNWIISLPDRRLIIFDNQEPDFFGLRTYIENMLSDERYNTFIRKAPDFSYASSGNRSGKVSLRTLKKRLSPFNTAIIAVNILVFIIVLATGFGGKAQSIKEGGALSWQRIMRNKEYYRMITHMFLHSDLEHLLSNMMVLIFVGNSLENIAGRLKYLVIYFGSGIIAGIASISYNMIKAENVMSIGASGAIFGVVGAMIYIIIVSKGRVEGISGRRMIFFALVSIYAGIRSAGIDNAAHIGGLLAGIILAVIIYRKNKKPKNGRQAYEG
jgi:rhomboid protease GluP